MNKKALTLLEIIVATVILALIMAGMASVFVTSRQFLLHSRYRVSAAELGKRFIDPLQVYVRAEDWYTNPLGGSFTIGSSFGSYSSSCDCVTLMPGSLIKRVKCTISWPE